MRDFSNTAFETVPLRVWLTMALSSPVKEESDITETLMSHVR